MAKRNKERGEPSVVEHWGLYSSPCGYCKSDTNSSISCGLSARSLSVYDYQDLLNRGWRRLGMLLYKPEMAKTCCRAYTIRLKAESFFPTKEQNRVMYRMQSLRISIIEVPNVALRRVKPTTRKRIKTSTGEAVYSCSVAFTFAATLSKHKDCNLVVKALQHSNGYLERQSNDSRKFSPAVLAELFAAKLQNKDGMHGFVVEACNGHLNFVLRNPATLDLWKREDLHLGKSANGDSETCIIKSMKVYGISHRETRRVLEVRMRRSSFDPEEFALYKRYQIAVHHDTPDDVKESSYVEHLVDSPLVFVPPSESGTTFCGFGSFHQQYLIDGCLVAVGVVDILPSCLSSKYLFWDPDLAFLSLGKYSALQEIQWVQKAQKVCPSLEYYYLGYYIHTCPKMTYKGAYRPSELLCPVRFQWVPLDIAQPLLNILPFVCLSDGLDATVKQKHAKFVVENTSVVMEDSEANNEIVDIEDNRKLDVSDLGGAASTSKEWEDVNNILLKLGNQFLRFKHLQAHTAVPQKFMDALVYELRKYSHVVGPILATKMAYVLS